MVYTFAPPRLTEIGELEQYSDRIKLTDRYDTDHYYEFPINPQECTLSFGQRIKEKEVAGKDGSIIQNLGLKAKTITLTGLIKDGVYFSKNKHYYFKEDLLKKLVNDMVERKTIWTLTGIFLGFTDALNVVVTDTNSLRLTAAKPKIVSYTLSLKEWTDYNITGGQIEKVNLVSQQALTEFLSAVNRARLRRT